MTRNECLDQKIMNCSRLVGQALSEISGYKEFEHIAQMLKKTAEEVQKAADNFGKVVECEERGNVDHQLIQFHDLKAKHPDAVLLFRKGDCYVSYQEDAEKTAKILGITLTKSSNIKDVDGKPFASAVFPYHALDTYLPKLIRAGQRVAIADSILN